MPFDYSCFISYRHTKYKQNSAYLEKIVESLAGELERRVEAEVCRDKERLKGASFYNEALAGALCRSVCMIALYCPTYFSVDHPFCSREFRAMEELERKRLDALHSAQAALQARKGGLSRGQLKLLNDMDVTNGLIIVVALCDFESIPEHIQQRRNCYNFEPYTLRGNLERNQEFRKEINEISQYVARQYRVFNALDRGDALDREGDVCGGCDGFKLPAEETIKPWIVATTSYAGNSFPFW